MPLRINFIAVIIAVVINFILGFIWYASLFAKAWTKEMGYDPNVRDVRYGREYILIDISLSASS